MFFNMTVLYISGPPYPSTVYIYSVYLLYVPVLSIFLSVYKILSVSATYLSGLFTDPSEGDPTHRRSWVTSLVIHQSGAVQRHPLGPGM